MSALLVLIIGFLFVGVFPMIVSIIVERLFKKKLSFTGAYSDQKSQNFDDEKEQWYEYQHVRGSFNSGKP